MDMDSAPAFAASVTTPKGVLGLLASALLVALFLVPRRGKGDERFPSWILLEGHLLGLCIMQGGLLRRLVYVSPRSKETSACLMCHAQFSSLLRFHHLAAIYGVTRKHVVIPDPKIGHAVLRCPEYVLNNHMGKWAFSVRVFGCHPGTRADFDANAPSLFAAVTRHLVQQPSVVLDRTCTILGRWVPSLIGTHMPLTDQREAKSRPWLRDAAPTSIDAVSPGQSWGQESTETTEVDLYTLARDFTAFVSITALAGADFLHTHPSFIRDLFTLDGGFALLALGLPTWLPVRAMREAVDARARMMTAIDQFQRRIDAVALGTADDHTQQRCADVNGLFWDRNTIYRECPLAFADRAPNELALFWAMNANTSPFVSWVLAHVYASTEVLRAIRAEVEPHIQLPEDSSSMGEHSGLGDSKEPSHGMTFDAPAILQRCPRLRAAVLETFRLESQPTSLRRVEKNLTVNLGKPPARVEDVVAALTYTIPPRTFVSVPHMVAQLDAQLYPDPLAFRPERFLTMDNDSQAGKGSSDAASAFEEGTGDHTKWKVAASMLKPWGEGSGICKGRVFAEREVILMVALIVATWEMAPVARTAAGEWQFPQKVPGTGVCQPNGGLRVRLKRRER